MITQQKPQGRCSGCNAMVSLCKDGTIFQHGQGSGGKLSHCPGSGKPPGPTLYWVPELFKFPPVKGSDE